MTMRGTPSLAVPPTQNTAPVLEFNCLYTHDLRRKQKRWQDGFLRFHTFNKRIMVYDVPRNFIGDAHWNAEELEDGDEVTLDKGGVLVQVAESVGRTETDLTELFKSKKKASSTAASSSPIRASTYFPPPHQPIPPSRQASTNTVQLKHRSLNALLGTPKGRIGKAALPTKSPFEERLEAENVAWQAGRPPKRRRLEEVPTRHRADETGAHAVYQNSGRPREPALQRQANTEIIGLCSDPPDPHRFLAGFSDEALGSPQSSPQHRPAVPDMSGAVRSSSTAFQRQKTPEKERVARRAAKSLVQPAEDMCRSNRIPHMPKAGAPSHYLLQEELAIQSHQSERAKASPSTKSRKTLRMAASAPKKKTLLCKDQLFDDPIHVPDNESTKLTGTSKHVASKHFGRTSQRQQLEQRLARIGKKAGKDSEKSLDRNETGIEEADQPPSHSNATVAEPAQHDLTVIVSKQQRLPEAVVCSGTHHRQLRRVESESRPPKDERSTTAQPCPVRDEESLAPAAEPGAGNNITGRNHTSGSDRLKPRAKRPLDRAVSLNLASNGTSTVILNRAFRLPQPPKMNAAVPDVTANPWSREAFDLLTWRPPGWDEESWCIKEVAEAVAVTQT